MKTKYTPGPWKILYGGMDDDLFATIGSSFGEYPICQLEPMGYNQANAHLIAAAPELLEEGYVLAMLVLQSPLYHYHEPGLRDAVDKFLAIHAKAEGNHG